MLKHSLAIIVVGSLITSSSFATPLNVKTMFMKNQTTKSSLVSKKHAQLSQFKFSGTWAGTCNDAGQNREIKIRINEDDTQLAVTDLINGGGEETYSFNVVKSESTSDSTLYDSFTSRLARVNENTLRLEGTGVFGYQLPSSDQDKGFLSGVFTSTATVNNNQLIIDTNLNINHANKNESIETKCTLNRAG